MKLILPILLIALSVHAQQKSVNTLASESNKHERAKKIQYYGEPDTSWMMTNAGWLRRRSIAMMATNKNLAEIIQSMTVTNRAVTIPKEIIPPLPPATKPARKVAPKHTTRAAAVFQDIRMVKLALTPLTPPPNLYELSVIGNYQAEGKWFPMFALTFKTNVANCKVFSSPIVTQFGECWCELTNVIADVPTPISICGDWPVNQVFLKVELL